VSSRRSGVLHCNKTMEKGKRGRNRGRNFCGKAREGENAGADKGEGNATGDDPYRRESHRIYLTEGKGPMTERAGKKAKLGGKRNT